MYAGIFSVPGFIARYKDGWSNNRQEKCCGSYLENGYVGVGHGRFVNEMQCPVT